MKWLAGALLALALASCGGKQKAAAPTGTSCSDDSACSPFKCGAEGTCLQSCDFDQDCADGFICAKDKFAIEGRCGTSPSDARPTSTDQ